MQSVSNRQAKVKPLGVGERVDVSVAGQRAERPMFGCNLMEAIVERNNLKQALQRVESNQGSAGVDGMSVEELPEFLKENWLSMKEQLLKGEYVPQAVKRVEIPKPGRKEKRKLGIPTVLDRFIQQATLQVLQGKWDERFSESSYGFRPKRKAASAVRQAQEYLKTGYSVVVDIDLERFFDRVCHDRLMSRLAQEIEDKRVLKLIRSYLTAGILENGLVSIPTEGTPQGGPLSPFLSNVVLDELDKELERRGHHFVRYADDSNIYVRSQRAGERVMESVSRFIEKKLKLRVNSEKSAVGEPKRRKFLGFSFTGGREPNRIKIAEPSLQRFRAQVRRITRRNRGRRLEEVVEQLKKYLIGWRGYFQLAQTPTIFRDLDSWIRRRLRSLLWKQWKVYANRKRELIQRGVPEDLAQSEAWSAKGPWRMSHAKAVQMALPNRYFDTMGLPNLAALNI